MCCGQYNPAINVINLNCNIWSLSIQVWSLCERSTTVEVRVGGGGSRTIHPMYISSIGSLIKKKKRSATLDLGLSHFNSLRQQTALTTTVSTNHFGQLCQKLSRNFKKTYTERSQLHSNLLFGNGTFPNWAI